MQIPFSTFAEELFLNPVDAEKIPLSMIIRGVYIRPEEESQLRPRILYFWSENNITKYCIYSKVPDLKYTGTIPDHSLADMLNSALELLNRYRQFESSIELYLERHEPMQSYIPVMSEFMGNPVYIVDASYRVLAIDDSKIYTEISAIWKRLVEDRYLSYDILKKLKENNELAELTQKTPARLVAHSKVFPTSFINCPIFRDNHLIGHFFVVGYNKKITPGKIALAEQIRLVLQSVFKDDLRYNPIRNRGYENFFIHMLTNTLHDPYTVKRQCQALEIEMSGYFLIGYLPLNEYDSLKNEAMMRMIEEVEEAMPFVYNGGITIFFHFRESNVYLSLLKRLRMVAKRGECQIGISDLFFSFEDIKLYFEQAVYTSEHTLSSEPGVCAYNQYAVPQLLSQTQVGKSLSGICDPAIKIKMLAEYDRQHDSEYYRTLKVYLENERNLTVTAAILHIHRNTLLYRIERLHTLTMTDLDQTEVRLRLLLSFKIYEIIHKEQ